MSDRARVETVATKSQADAPKEIWQRSCDCGWAKGPAGQCADCGRKPLVIQTKLAVNRPGDHYEQEADRVADMVMRMEAGQFSGSTNGKPRVSLQRQAMNNEEDEEELVQRQALVEEEGGAEETVQRQTLVDKEEEEEETLQPKESPGRLPSVSAGAEAQIDRLQSSGRPLPEETRAFFEPRFGHDFSQVRIHTGGQAAQAAHSVNAEAFTIDRHIVFGNGKYAPESSNGATLLAHELTHVIQQQGGRRLIQRKPAPPTEIVRVDIFLDSGRVLVTTKDNAYDYELDKKKAPGGGTNIKSGEEVPFTHTEGEFSDSTETTGKFFWTKGVDLDGPSPQWGDFPTSTQPYKVVTRGVSKATSEESQEEGTSEQEGKEGEGAGKKGTGEGKVGKGDGGAKKSEEKLKEFLNKAAQNGEGEPKTPTTDEEKEELKALLEDLSEAEIEAFFKLLSEIAGKCSEEGKCPNKSYAEVLEFYKNLSPPDREALAINQMLKGDPEGAYEELPSEILLAIEAEAGDTAAAAKNVNDINKNLALIQAKITDPELRKQFDPIDPATLSEFNTILMLQGMLAGASERSPEIESLAKDVTTNLSRIKDFILEEIAWLAAEIAATELIAILAAPFTAGGSSVAGAAAASILIVRLNRFRKLLLKLQKLQAVISQVQTIIDTVNKVRNLDVNKGLFEEYEQKAKKLVELRALLKAEDAPADIGLQIEAAEDELLAFMQEKVLVKLEGILDSFYLPPDATNEELKQMLFDIPTGIDALDEMLAFRERVEAGNVDDSAVLALKGFRAGYLLAPFVGFLTGLINDKLEELMQEQDLMDRLTGFITGGRRGKKGKKSKRKSERKAENKKRFEEVKSNKEKRKEDKKKAKEEEKKAKKEGKDPQAAGINDGTAWGQLKSELVALAGKAKKDGGITKTTLQGDVKAIVNKAKYKKYGPKESVGDRSDKPAHFLVTVKDTKKAKSKGKKKKKKQKNLRDIEILFLRPERTRYQLIRNQIKKDFKKWPENKRKKEEIEKHVKKLTGHFEYQGIRVEETTADDGTVTALRIMGTFRGGAPSEIISIDMPGNYWGSKNKPIDMQWPKRSITKYEPVYIGPYVGDGVTVPQKDLKDLKDKDSSEKRTFANDLKTKVSSQSLKDGLDNWDLKIVEHKPTQTRKKLPSPSRTEIGVEDEWQVKKNSKFRLKPQGSTPGGGKIMGPLKKFGFISGEENKQGDHIWEYKLGGPDDTKNLWPLHQPENSASPGVLNSMRFPKPGGDGVVTMDKLKKDAKQKQIWFKIARTKSIP